MHAWINSSGSKSVKQQAHYNNKHHIEKHILSFIIMNYSSNDVNGPAVAVILNYWDGVCLDCWWYCPIVVTITQRKSWKQPSTIFFTSFKLTHLVMLLLYLPFFMISSAASEWIFANTLEEKGATCSFAAYTVWYGAIVVYQWHLLQYHPIDFFSLSNPIITGPSWNHR